MPIPLPMKSIVLMERQRTAGFLKCQPFPNVLKIRLHRYFAFQLLYKILARIQARYLRDTMTSADSLHLSPLKS